MALRNRSLQEESKLRGADRARDSTKFALGQFNTLQNWIPAQVYSIKKKRGVDLLVTDPVTPQTPTPCGIIECIPPAPQSLTVVEFFGASAIGSFADSGSWTMVQNNPGGEIVDHLASNYPFFPTGEWVKITNGVEVSQATETPADLGFIPDFGTTFNNGRGGVSNRLGWMTTSGSQYFFWDLNTFVGYQSESIGPYFGVSTGSRSCTLYDNTMTIATANSNFPDAQAHRRIWQWNLTTGLIGAVSDYLGQDGPVLYGESPETNIHDNGEWVWTCVNRAIGGGNREWKIMRFNRTTLAHDSEYILNASTTRGYYAIYAVSDDLIYYIRIGAAANSFEVGYVTDWNGTPTDVLIDSIVPYDPGDSGKLPTSSTIFMPHAIGSDTYLYLGSWNNPWIAKIGPIQSCP